jgi:DNA-binding response OmpR family regulator
MAKIVVVDDERAIQLILQAILRIERHDIIMASDGAAGLSLIYHYQPDLVILDDMLPDISGSEICRRLKADPFMRHIPVILHSAGHRVRDYNHITAIGVDAALRKPVPSEELVEVVHNLLAARL